MWGSTDLLEPHLLMMSATPIPRTLAMTYFADLDVSTIDELPPGRSPIVTKLFADSKRLEVIDKIRLAAEEEEREFYAGRATPEWLEDLAHLGTDPEKPFLESAPWLIAVFAERFRRSSDGAKRANYYVPESVGIATGFMIAALHHAGLATLTHTPSPM